MYIGDVGIKMIMCDGVANSKTLAGVHFEDNRVSHWLKIQIYFALVKGGGDVHDKLVREEKNADHQDDSDYES